MLPASTYFTAEAVKKIRRVGETLLVSWLKTYDDDVNFFSIGQSSIGGSDIIKGWENTILEWDKYDYVDESKYVVAFTYEREFMEYGGGIVKSMADITLDNYSDRFTPGYDATIGNYIVPKRPVKLAVKFGEDSVPIFAGQTEETPLIDNTRKLTSLKCIDYIDFLWNYPLDETSIQQGARSDELIEALLIASGLGVGQYELDVGILNIPFSIFPKGEKVGKIIQQIVQAEMGHFFQDENGLLKFYNRHHGLSPDDNKVRYTFDRTNILEIKSPRDQNVINTVEVRGEAREIQGNQTILTSYEAILIEAGDSVDIWANYDDPVTSVDNVTDFYGNSAPDGSGIDLTSDLSVSNQDNFVQASKITFTNSGSSSVYLTEFTVTGIPAKITATIEGKVIDIDSIAKYDERVLTIDNPFIQNNSDANTMAQIIVDQYKDADNIKEIVIRGMPYLQLNDRIAVIDSGIHDDYYITRIQGQMTKPNGFIQTITAVKKNNWYKYFQIGISGIGKSDRIAP